MFIAYADAYALRFHGCFHAVCHFLLAGLLHAIIAAVTQRRFHYAYAIYLLPCRYAASLRQRFCHI